MKISFKEIHSESSYIYEIILLCTNTSTSVSTLPLTYSLAVPLSHCETKLFPMENNWLSYSL